MSAIMSLASVNNIVSSSVVDANSLYTFTTFTFTTANTVGIGASNTTQYLARYDTANNTWLTNTSYYNVLRNGYQLWTVPKTGNYLIEVAGARSGVNQYAGGLFSNGAIVRAQVALTKGDKINLIAGQPAANTINNSAYNGAGGGGGSFVVANTGNVAILIAGGGGGYGRYSGAYAGVIRAGSDGQLGNNGANTIIYGEAGGINGLGGKSHVKFTFNQYDGGGGGGFLGNGFNGGGSIANTTSGLYGGGGLSYANNLTGGILATSYINQATSGGFGGGGGGTPICGGGGGGYSGGAGTSANTGTQTEGGGGGGSYIISTATNVATSNGTFEKLSTFNGNSITNLNSYNSGGGYIIITLL